LLLQKKFAVERKKHQIRRKKVCEPPTGTRKGPVASVLKKRTDHNTAPRSSHKSLPDDVPQTWGLRVTRRHPKKKK